MVSVKYHRDSAEFFASNRESKYPCKRHQDIPRKVIEDQISEDTLRRLSLTKYVEDGEWLEAVRTFTRAEEDWKERKSL